MCIDTNQWFLPNFCSYPLAELIRCERKEIRCAVSWRPMSYATARRREVNSEINKLYPEDRAVHEWYRFVLSFPPHLVREYLTRFGLGTSNRVLDPFCGTGTVLVEAKKLGISSVGVEANPMAYFASRVKTDWAPDPDGLVRHAQRVAESARSELESQGILDEAPLLCAQNEQASLRTLPPESDALLLAGS